MHTHKTKMQAAVETIQKHREVFEKLNVVTVEVRYEGAGDSGEITYIAYLDKDNGELWAGWLWDKEDNIFSQTKIEAASLHGYRRTEDGYESIWREGSVQDLVESIALMALPGGWEINEGSSGSLWIDLSGQGPLISIDHDWVVTTTENEMFTSEEE